MDQTNVTLIEHARQTRLAARAWFFVTRVRTDYVCLYGRRNPHSSQLAA